MRLDIKNFKTILLKSVGSTNTHAREMVAGGRAENAIIIAEKQTAGRTTKKGSPWFSPKGNLYFTMLVALDREDEHRFPQLSFLSALSVVESIQTAAEGAADVKIKWPNDVLLNVKKVSGILIEKEDAWAIIGIGINVNSSPGTKLVVYPTTSLANEKIAVSADELGKILANNLIRNMNELKNDGFKSIVARVKPFMYRMGEQIFITFRTGQISGVFEGLADTGGIIVDVGDDKITLLSGEMTKENFV